MQSPNTIPELFFGAIERFGTKQAAMRYKSGGQWIDITHQELARRVHHIALGLLELGVTRGDRVAILSNNRPEWAFADYACMNIGCVDVAIYATLTAAQIQYLLQDSGAGAIFVSDRKQFDKLAEIRDHIPNVLHIISFDDLGEDVPATPLNSLERRGAAVETKYPDYVEMARHGKPDDLATLIYTSGTTGDPKGVMLTHGNFTSNINSALEVIHVDSRDSCLSLLPLSHAFERMAGNYLMLQTGATINYAESIDAVSANLLEIHPTIMVSVPRLYEKIFSRVLEKAMSGGAIKRRIFFWARKTGELGVDYQTEGRPLPTSLTIKKRLADKLVFSKLRHLTGGRLRFFVSGGAPLAPEIAKFFAAAGLPILEGYGLTETSPVICVNRLESLRVGTVGLTLPNVQVRIAEDGEVLTKGPHVMRGYYNKPEATAEAIDDDGWFRTGDIGEIDSDGYLRITDRKKDLIVTAGGKKIAPQPIENRVKTSPLIANAVMLGDKRKYAIILVVPEHATLRKWAVSRELNFETIGELIQMPEVVARIEREVMGPLRDLARFEMPKKIVMIENDFSEENGELTPTLKVKRRVIEHRYATQIDQAYADADAVPLD